MEKKQEESPFAGMSMEELVKKMIEHTKELDRKSTRLNSSHP